MDVNVAASPRPRGALGLIVDRHFGSLFWAKILSVVGIWTHGLVAAVVVHDATRSSLMVGLVGVAQFGPQLVFVPYSGKWADRGDPTRQIYLGRILCALGSGTIALWLALAPGAMGHTVTAVFAGSLVVGVGFAVGGPAMQSIVPNLIRAGELPTAMALNSVPMTVGRVAGPAVGAAVVARFDPATAFATSAIMSLAFVVLIVAARLPRPDPPSRDTDFRIRVAVAHVRGDRPLFLALVAVATLGFASDPAITLSPSVAEAVGGGVRLVGALSTAFGGGATAALLLLAAQRGHIRSARGAQLGLWCLVAGNAVLVFARNPGYGLAGFGLAGLGFGIAMSALSTIVQERAPQELRGRIMGLWMLGFLGSRPVAAMILGGAADFLSLRVSFVIAATVAALTALWCRPSALSSPTTPPS